MNPQEKENTNKNTKPAYPGNSIMVRPDGPLICKGEKDITLQNADSEVITKDKEFALCRCGLSKAKPFCDGSHKIEGFKSDQEFTDDRMEDISTDSGELIISVKENAMYILKGPVTIFSRSGLSVTTRTKGALCRCGQSAKKPFCDLNHKQCGFVG